MLGTDKCQLAYADGWKSFQPSLDALGINFEQSQPGVHQTNGIIEAIRQDIVKATRCLLENASFRRTCGRTRQNVIASRKM